MSVQKTLTVAFLLLLFTSLSASLSIYSQIQQGISLEGNQLYSKHAVLIAEEPTQIISTLTAAKVNTRIYRSLSEDGQIRAIFEVGERSASLPIHEGRQFARHDTHAVMVGSEVPVTTVNGESFYEFDGTNYLVVATLGLGERSLLSEDVLIKDDTFFSGDEADDFVIDGVDAAAEIERAFGPDAYAQRSSATDRRTNIDYVSLILLSFGWSLAVLGCAITALLFVKYTWQKDVVRHQLGHTRWRIILSNTLRLSIIIAVSTTPAILFIIMRASAPETAEIAIAAIFGQAILVLVLSGVAIIYRTWNQRAWM